MTEMFTLLELFLGMGIFGIFGYMIHWAETKREGDGDL